MDTISQSFALKTNTNLNNNNFARNSGNNFAKNTNSNNFGQNLEGTNNNELF